MNFDINHFILFLCVAALPLLFAITLHEAAHGYIASLFGDKTAKMLGRVSLNPARHIDLFGTILLPIILLFFGGFIFGWAKPVPITWQNLRHPRRDAMLVAFAGPFANFLMALLWAMILKIFLVLSQTAPNNFWVASTGNFFILAGQFGIKINCALFVLNLLPIPPLDGSRIVSEILPGRLANIYNRIEPYGMWILLFLVVTRILGILLIPPMVALMSGIAQIFSIPF